jgi:type II secretory pathway component PulC
MAGDLIVEVNHQTVRSAGDAFNAVQAAPKGEVSLYVVRSGVRTSVFALK